MVEEHFEGKAVQLLDGRVLVAGSVATPGPDALLGAEVYDPIEGTWKSTTVPTIRIPYLWDASLTLLSGPNCGFNCGKVLVVGGELGNTAVSQLFDPITNTWSPATPPQILRQSHSATLLSGPDCAPDCGKVLVVGGQDQFGANASRTGELFDPSTPAGSWTPIAGRTPEALPQANAQQQGIYLRTGRVLVVGPSPFLYEPSSRTWLRTPSTTGINANGSQTLLPNGKVLTTSDATNQSNIYDPEPLSPSGEAGAWSAGPPLNFSRDWTPVTLLTCDANLGRVLATGIFDLTTPGKSNMETTEIFDGVPTVQKVAPPQAEIGSQANLTITGFGFNTGAVKVRFGDVEKDPSSVSPDGKRLEVSPPPADSPVSLPVAVTVDGVTADTCLKQFSFDYVAPGAANLPGAVPLVNVADAAFPEGDIGTTTARFAVSLSAPASTPVTLDFSMSDGSATNGSDYRQASGKLTFPPGSTTQTIGAEVIGDTAVEPDETFTLSLRADAGATLLRVSATGTILNDDTTPERPTTERNQPSAPGNSVQQRQAPNPQQRPQQAGQTLTTQQPQALHAQTQPQQAAQAQQSAQPQTQVTAQAQPAFTLERERQIQLQTEKLAGGEGKPEPLLASSRPAPPTAPALYLTSLALLMLAMTPGPLLSAKKARATSPQAAMSRTGMIAGGRRRTGPCGANKHHRTRR